MLLIETAAREYHRVNGQRFDDAEALLQDIDRWLASKGLAQSTISRVSIAQAVLRLEREAAREQLEAPEVAAWNSSIAEGTTADDTAALRYANDVALASQVAQMTVQEFGQHRARFGLAKSTMDHLSGL